MKTKQIVDLLNKLFEMDPMAIEALVTNKVPCNRKIANHKTVTVSTRIGKRDCYMVGMLGVLQGIVGLDGEGIEGLYENKGDEENQDWRLIGFRMKK
jgi:hypothetical protein